MGPNPTACCRRPIYRWPVRRPYPSKSVGVNGQKRARSVVHCADARHTTLYYSDVRRAAPARGGWPSSRLPTDGGALSVLLFRGPDPRWCLFQSLPVQRSMHASLACGLSVWMVGGVRGLRRRGAERKGRLVSARQSAGCCCCCFCRLPCSCVSPARSHGVLQTFVRNDSGAATRGVLRSTFKQRIGTDRRRSSAQCIQCKK